ncbi:MAG: 5'/3'-nucleotidase SurE, partial [Firmicutes bacterium]|nr:5'/3'-nucleotidase SurE [Bacillota bacterium]
MKILLTNDDGIFAEGIHALYRSLASWTSVYVVAPEQERSAMGHAITMHKPLHAKETVFESEASGHAWAVNGTPVDCTKLGIEALLPSRPDLLLSGINRGANLGRDVFYSGTVSAAMEGMFLGVPSIALSYDDGDEEGFAWVADFVSWWLQQPSFVMPPQQILYNINFPSLKKKTPGKMVAVRLGNRHYVNDFHRRLDPRGQEYFWL